MNTPFQIEVAVPSSISIACHGRPFICKRSVHVHLHNYQTLTSPSLQRLFGINLFFFFFFLFFFFFFLSTIGSLVQEYRRARSAVIDSTAVVRKILHRVWIMYYDLVRTENFNGNGYELGWIQTMRFGVPHLSPRRWEKYADWIGVGEGVYRTCASQLWTTLTF